jgi:hypothetical protein
MGCSLVSGGTLPATLGIAAPTTRRALSATAASMAARWPAQVLAWTTVITFFEAGGVGTLLKIGCAEPIGRLPIIVARAGRSAEQRTKTTTAGLET